LATQARATTPPRPQTPTAWVLAWLLTALLLAATTLLVFGELRRYNLEPVPWPIDPRFERLAAGATAAAPTPGWQVEGDARGGVTARDGVLRLRSDDPNGVVGVRQRWRLDPDGPRAFRLAATLGAEAIKGGRAGKVSLVADADIGRGDLTAAHQLAALGGTRAPARYVAQFEFPRETREIELAIRLRHAKGTLSVRDLQLVALRERWLVRAGRLVLPPFWAVTLIAGCWLFARGVDGRRSGLLLAVAGGGGLVLLLLPQTWRDAVIEPLAGLVPDHLVSTEQLGDLGHFAIFAVAGLLVRLSRRRDPWWAQLLLLIGLAGLSELLQHLAELRAPTLADGLTNAAGALVGWLPAAWWIRRRRRRQEGQLATQRLSSTTVPPQSAKQPR
jgi:hypothetical protein